MKVHYELLRKDLYACERPYTTCGILIRDQDTNIVIRKISDISTDHEAIGRLVGLCNTCSLSAEHLEDIVQDFLSV